MPSMVLRLFDAAGAQANFDTAGSGIGNCPALVVDLPAGTYYVQVSAAGSVTVPAYLLEVRFEGDRGSEVEPNETTLTASVLAGSDSAIFGDHQVLADVDVYAVTVPAGASGIRAEIVEGDGTETCESNGIDSYLTLYDSAGSTLTSDDDTGRGFCSLIDGTGALPLDPSAGGLSPGTYYLEVKRPFSATGASGLFNYKLVVTIR
ncbi:MAG: PPC domain-containing protein [Deltaproteobacteria bacterium]|nr:PPC domain-containing protein [Deltaproteobacteria bacterium]